MAQLLTQALPYQPNPILPASGRTAPAAHPTCAQEHQRDTTNGTTKPNRWSTIAQAKLARLPDAVVYGAQMGVLWPISCSVFWVGQSCCSSAQALGRLCQSLTAWQAQDYQQAALFGLQAGRIALYGSCCSAMAGLVLLSSPCTMPLYAAMTICAAHYRRPTTAPALPARST